VERLSEREKEEIVRLSGLGLPSRLIGQEIGRHHRTVWGHLQRLRRLAPPGPIRSPLRLSLREREEISRGLAAGESRRSIARRLGRSPSTIVREVARNGDARRYRACSADRAALVRARRPKVAKVVKPRVSMTRTSRGAEAPLLHRIRSGAGNTVSEGHLYARGVAPGW
jgi:IS30 family transposase